MDTTDNFSLVHNVTQRTNTGCSIRNEESWQSFPDFELKNQICLQKMLEGEILFNIHLEVMEPV